MRAKQTSRVKMVLPVSQRMMVILASVNLDFKGRTASKVRDVLPMGVKMVKLLQYGLAQNGTL